jgi:hypothetical protein
MQLSKIEVPKYLIEELIDFAYSKKCKLQSA